MAPKVQILENENYDELSNVQRHEPCYGRIQYVDTIDGQAVKSTRYVRVFPGVLASNWLEPDTDLPFPEFPSGDWELVDLELDGTMGDITVSDPRNLDLDPEIHAWHSLSIDYLDLEKHLLLVYPFVWLVKHDLFPSLVLLKFEDFLTSNLEEVGNETDVYRAIDGKGIAPKFLAHVTENGRIIGFLSEYIEDGRPGEFKDVEAMEKALKKLHNEGLLHNDPHFKNFLVRPDGTATLIDFEFSRAGSGKMFDAEISLLRGESGEYTSSP